MNKLTEWLVKPLITEDINIPVNVGDTVLIQGVNIYWRLACREGEICRVTPLGCSGPYIDVHRTCLIYVSKDR